MKQQEIPFLPLAGDTPLLTEVVAGLDQLSPVAIAAVCWPQYPYKPAVSVTLAHNGSWLLLKYKVGEKDARARYRRTHDPVYRDSCVELFLAFNQEQAYYNLEFNRLGTCLSGFGAGRNNRVPAPEALVAKIKRRAEMQPASLAAGGETSWQLTLMIPVEFFWQHPLTSFQGLQARGNFFKCGDDLREPHFLSWNAIAAPAPDFHLPAYFGELQFA